MALKKWLVPAIMAGAATVAAAIVVSLLTGAAPRGGASDFPATARQSTWPAADPTQAIRGNRDLKY